MKHLFLLVVAIALIGIVTQALACNYERMSRIPEYSEINKPKKSFKIPQAHGICVAPNGNFAVVSWNNAGKIYLYSACGKRMKVVNAYRGYRKAAGCAFTNHRLYVADYYGKKVHEYSPSGKFIRFVITGLNVFRITACQNRLYIIQNFGGRNVRVYNTNGRQIRTIAVPGGGRTVLVGIDGNLHVSNWQRRQVYTCTPNGKRVGLKTYKEVQYTDDLAMDSAGNLLIADHRRGKVMVYSPCGALIKTIRTGTRIAADVKIGNDGTVMVADYSTSKVFLY